MDDDENDLLSVFERTEPFKGRVATSTVKVIRSELSVVNKESGMFDLSVNLEEINQVRQSLINRTPLQCVNRHLTLRFSLLFMRLFLRIVRFKHGVS
jgi:hypothetical protein